MPFGVQRQVKWNSADHPRDPAGRFRRKDLKPGAYTYTVGREERIYYINELGQLAKGSALLSMAARGEVFGSECPIERIHLMGTENQEMLAVAAMGNGVFGVVNHDKAAPENPFALNRGSKFEYASERVRGEADFAGEKIQLSGRPDGIKYDTLNAQAAEKRNREAFDTSDPNVKVYSASPGEFADKAADVRRYYQETFGMSEYMARKQPVYVYKDGRTGELVVAPALRPGRRPGEEMVARRSPNTHQGSGAAKVYMTDLTRMTRAMQDENLQSVQFSISTSADSRKNALHFRQNYDSSQTFENQTVWGTITGDPDQEDPYTHRQKPPRGVKLEDSHATYSDVSGKVDPLAHKAWLEKRQAQRDKRAEKYWYPKTPSQAADLLNVKYADNSMPNNITMLGNGRFRLAGRDLDHYYDARGVAVGYHINTRRGFAKLFSQKTGTRLPPNRVQRTLTGFYVVNHHYYDEWGRNVSKEDARKAEEERMRRRREG